MKGIEGTEGLIGACNTPVNNLKEAMEIVQEIEGISSGDVDFRISEPTPEVEKVTVGDEFVEWAEKYWGLKRKYDVQPDGNDEGCPYNYVKEVFAAKIDKIIIERLSL